MIYVTSDLHGYPLNRFLRLLDKARFSDTDQLIVLGDVIDRNGDGGIRMLRWMVQQPNVWLILGNHEAMLLSCSFCFQNPGGWRPPVKDDVERELLRVWKANGGTPTLSSLRDFFREDPGAAEALMQYVREAPLYELCQAYGRLYVLTHAGLGGFAPQRQLSDYTADELLWHRPAPDERYYTDATVIFGHTPTAFYGQQYTDRMLRTSTWINIDTGAGQGRHPMLLRLGDERPFYADD